MNSFYSRAELAEIGFKKFGEDVMVSRKVSIYNPGAIELGSHVRIDDFAIISGGSGIVIGNYVHIGAFCALFGSAGIIMEDFSGLSGRVTIYSESDDYSGRSLTNPTTPDEFKKKSVGQVILKKHVIIGAASTILPRVVIEEGAAVGAHSLVTKKCEAWSVYFGAPAKKISRRRKDLLALEAEFLTGQ